MAGFFAMGGYGAFVWTGWGLTLVFVLLLWLHTETRLAKLESQLQSQGGKRQNRRKKPARSLICQALVSGGGMGGGAVFFPGLRPCYRSDRAAAAAPPGPTPHRALSYAERPSPAQNDPENPPL